MAAFTDTTATAALIIAQLPANAPVGYSWKVEITNTTAFPETIVGGTNVTLSGQTVVQAYSTATFLATYATSTTVTLQGIFDAPNFFMPATQYTTDAATTTMAAGALTGAAFTAYQNTAATPGSIQVRTAAQMVADIPGAQVGMSYLLRVICNNGAAHTLTITTAAGVTLLGAMTIPDVTWRDFIVTITNVIAPAMTFQTVGTGTAP